MVLVGAGECGRGGAGDRVLGGVGGVVFGAGARGREEFYALTSGVEHARAASGESECGKNGECGVGITESVEQAETWWECGKGAVLWLASRSQDWRYSR